MNAGLVVEKLPTKPRCKTSPIKPKVIARETHKHRAHAKVDPARGNKRAHTRVDHRIARLSTLPREQSRLADTRQEIIAERLTRPRHTTRFDVGFIFQLLDEVAVPREAREKTPN